MTRNNASIEELRRLGYQAINDFSLSQCLTAIKAGDKYTVANEFGVYIRVRFVGIDGWATGDMMRRATEAETAAYIAERDKGYHSYQVKRKEFPDWKQDD